MAQENGWMRRIRSMARRGALPHAVILSGPGSDGEAARFLCAAMLCTGQDKPCMQCPACRKVLSGIHPDVRVAEDAEHKELPMELVRQLRQDAYIRPNEGARKIFVFPDSACLNERDQNVLLKIVEEGPPYAAFVFCAVTAASLLPTVRSRCVELKLHEESEDAPPDEGALALCRVLCSADRSAVAAHLVGLESKRIKREQLQQLLRGAWQVCASALLQSAGAAPAAGEAGKTSALLCRSLPPAALQKLTDVLRRYADECDYNVGPGHVLGALLADWEQLTEKG